MPVIVVSPVAVRLPKNYGNTLENETKNNKSHAEFSCGVGKDVGQDKAKEQKINKNGRLQLLFWLGHGAEKTMVEAISRPGMYGYGATLYLRVAIGSWTAGAVRDTSRRNGGEAARLKIDRRARNRFAARPGR